MRLNFLKPENPARFVGAALLALSAAWFPAAAGAEEIQLLAGGAISGKILKRTAENLFLDLGFTIITIPLKEIKEVRGEEPQPPREAPTGSAQPAGSLQQPGTSQPAGTASSSAESRNAIYATAILQSGSIKDKASQMGEGVVQIVCPGKLGSGFIINEAEGYVMTNFHVIENDQDIKVVIYEKQSDQLQRVKLEKVRIVAFNPFLDLALLKIEDRQPAGVASRQPVALKKVYLGESSRTRPGDPVFAIGSPLGLERTVSEGIVSNNRRVIDGLLYIQTTASINPGNSGGPLFNERGEVIGITSLKLHGGESLGFAIPIDTVKDFLDNREAFAYDKDNANTGIRYYKPPPKTPPKSAQ